MIAQHIYDLKVQFPFIDYKDIFSNVQEEHMHFKFLLYVDVPREFIKTFLGSNREEYTILFNFAFNQYDDDVTTARRAFMHIFTNTYMHLADISSKLSFYNRPRTGVV